MYKIVEPLFIICETPLHAGTGSDLGIIDLPIQRERHTQYPKIEASGLKGALRVAFEDKTIDTFKINEHKVKIQLSFGYDPDGKNTEKVKKEEDGQFAGALGFSDARILLFPVKSLKGTFAWVTCPNVINKFIKDMSICKIKPDFTYINNDENTVVNNPILTINTEKTEVVLEDSLLTVKENENTTKIAEYFSKVIFPQTEEYIYWSELIKKNFIIISNDTFKDFVTLATEVITRTKINNETGTVKDGALFTEEYLPSETIMYTLSMFSPLFQNGSVFNNPYWQDEINEYAVRDFFRTSLPEVVQIGGNATLGKGLVKFNKYDSDTPENSNKKEGDVK